MINDYTWLSFWRISCEIEKVIWNRYIPWGAQIQIFLSHRDWKSCNTLHLSTDHVSHWILLLSFLFHLTLTQTPCPPFSPLPSIINISPSSQVSHHSPLISHHSMFTHQDPHHWSLFPHRSTLSFHPSSLMLSKSNICVFCQLDPTLLENWKYNKNLLMGWSETHILIFSISAWALTIPPVSRPSFLLPHTSLLIQLFLTIHFSPLIPHHASLMLLKSISCFWSK